MAVVAAKAILDGLASAGTGLGQQQPNELLGVISGLFPGFIEASWGGKNMLNKLMNLWHGTTNPEQVIEEGLKRGRSAELGIPGTSTSYDPLTSYEFAVESSPGLLRVVPHVDPSDVYNLRPSEYKGSDYSKALPYFNPKPAKLREINELLKPGYKAAPLDKESVRIFNSEVPSETYTMPKTAIENVIWYLKSMRLLRPDFEPKKTAAAISKPQLQFNESEIFFPRIRGETPISVRKPTSDEKRRALENIDKYYREFERLENQNLFLGMAALNRISGPSAVNTFVRRLTLGLESPPGEATQGFLDGLRIVSPDLSKKAQEAYKQLSRVDGLLEDVTTSSGPEMDRKYSAYRKAVDKFVRMARELPSGPSARRIYDLAMDVIGQISETLFPEYSLAIDLALSTFAREGLTRSQAIEAAKIYRRLLSNRGPNWHQAMDADAKLAADMARSSGRLELKNASPDTIMEY